MVGVDHHAVDRPNGFVEVEHVSSLALRRSRCRARSSRGSIAPDPRPALIPWTGWGPRTGGAAGWRVLPPSRRGRGGAARTRGAGRTPTAPPGAPRAPAAGAPAGPALRA